MSPFLALKSMAGMTLAGFPARFFDPACGEGDRFAAPFFCRERGEGARFADAFFSEGEKGDISHFPVAKSEMRNVPFFAPRTNVARGGGDWND